MNGHTTLSFRRLRPWTHGLCIAAVLLGAGSLAGADDRVAVSSAVGSPRDVLTPEQWKSVDGSIDRALKWLASKQRSDGSFQAPDSGQPAVTALCVLAFLSRGHLPGQGPYGKHIDRGIDYVISSRKPNGLLCTRTPGPSYQNYQPSHTAVYNHAIAGLLLCEVYGMAKDNRNRRLRETIQKAVALTLYRQKVPAKRTARDIGGWRYYVGPNAPQSDMSITSWNLMFLRSAKNAGFEVPPRPIDEALVYVKRCFLPKYGTFVYALHPGNDHPTVPMAGAGILSLSLGGEHDTAMARSAGDFILKHPLTRYNRVSVGGGRLDRYHYGVFYCTQGMFQLGGRHWRQFFPKTAQTLLTNQSRDGSWRPENHNNRYFGNVYTTSLVVLALATPYQVLPIFQR